MTRLTEKQLIAKIRGLKQLKPDTSWVILTKENIIGKEETSLSKWAWFFTGERFVFNHKLAFSALTVLIVFVGVFGFAQNSVPGDSLFSLKKITEQGQSYFVSAENQSKHNLELANKRLDDLTKIATKNEVSNLAPAISEYEESVGKVVQGLANNENSYILNELATEIQKLGEKEEQVKSLGIEIGQNEELNSLLADIVGKEILDMESRELTEKETEVLNSVKFEYEQGNYSKALEILLLK